MRPFIVMRGNPADGFRFVGPFETSDDAVEYIDKCVGNEEAWVVELLEPEYETVSCVGNA